MRRALRIVGWTVGAVLLLLMLLVSAVLILGNTSYGRSLIERETASLSNGQVRLTGLSGSFPQALQLEELQLSDAGGMWLRAQHVSLHWSPLALLARHIRIERLAVTQLDVERRPAPQPPKTEKSSFRVPHIDLRELSVDDLELGPQLAGTRVRLQLRGALHLKSLEDATAQLSARRSDGQGDYVLNLRFDPERMDANLKLEEPPGGPLENLLGYPGLGTLYIQAALHGARNAEHLELEAHAGALQAIARGNLDLVKQSADLNYGVDAPAMSPREGLSWRRVALHGRWTGSLSAARADARLRVEALEIPGGAGAAAIEASLTADGDTLALHATTEELTIPGPQPRLLAQSPLRIEATMRLGAARRPLQLEASHSLLRLQARAFTAGTPSVTFELSLPRLAPLAALAGQKIDGTSQLRGTIRQDSQTTHLELAADTQLASAPQLVAALLGGTSHLQLAAALTPQSLDVTRFTLAARASSLSVTGSARRATEPGTDAFRSLQARYQGNVPELAALTAAIAGNATLNGTIDGPLKSLTTALRVTSSLSVRGSPRQTVQADIKARGLPTLTTAELDAHGGFDGAPVQLHAALQRNSSGAYRLSVQRADWKSAHVDGDLTTGANLGPGHGTLRARIDRLADLQRLLGTNLDGAVRGSLELKPVRGHTDIEASLDAQDVVAASLRADAQLTARGSLDALRLRISARSPDVGGEPATLEAASRLNLDAHVLTLRRMELRYHKQSLHTLAPARLAFSDGLVVDTLKLGVQHAVIEVGGRLSPALDMRASVHHVDPALINAFVPNTLAQGNLDVEARLQGKPAAPSGLVTVVATGVRAASAVARDLHSVDLHARAQLSGDAAQLDAQLGAGPASQLSLTGKVPLSPDGALNLKLQGKVDAALANPLLEARGERAAGTLAVDAAVTGPARAPQVGGTVDLVNGEVRDYVQGVHLSEITAHLVGEHGTLRLTRLTARAGPGQLSMSGTIGVLEPKIPIELQLEAKNAQPVTSDIITASLDAAVKLAGNLRERLKVSGSVDLHRTMVGIPNSLPPDVGVLDVRRPGEKPPPPPERKLVIELDLQLHAPRQVLVQGRGLNAELGGDLRISGTSAAPSVSGGFEMIRGTFALAGSQLTFQKGEVSFNGAGLKGRIDPTLDFTADAQATDATVTLHITGLAQSPQFELSSQPPLPQDEIMARLLFGVSAAQLTTLQVAEIAAGLATLGGVGGSGSSPLVRVQKALGLDRLSVGSNGTTTSGQSAGTSLEAGRYVSSRVFVGARQSTTGFSQVEVDVDLTKHLKLQTRLGNGSATAQGTTPENDPGSTVGLTYQFEY
jgi:translocation and assembly module TamB